MPAARGVPKVEVTFDVDTNGILSVTAKDTATGKDQKITITASSGLSEAEIAKLVKEAAEHASEDKVRREQVERRNKLDNLCYSLEKSLHAADGKMQPADKSSLQALIKDGRDAVEQQNDDAIKTVTARLEIRAQEVASAMAGGASDSAAKPEPPRKDDVIDAEFEEAPPNP